MIILKKPNFVKLLLALSYFPFDLKSLLLALNTLRQVKIFRVYMILYDGFVFLIAQNGLKKSKKNFSVFFCDKKYAFVFKNVKKQLFLISLFVFNILLRICVCDQ